MTWVYILIGIGAIVLLKQIQYLVEERYEYYHTQSLKKKQKKLEILAEFEKESDTAFDPLFAFLRKIIETSSFYSTENAVRIKKLHKLYDEICDASEKSIVNLGKLVAFHESEKFNNMHPLQKFGVMHATAPLSLSVAIQDRRLQWVKNQMFFQTIEEACSLLLVEKKENNEFQCEIAIILEKAISYLEEKRIQLRNVPTFKYRVKTLRTVIYGLDIPKITIQYIQRLKLAS